MFSSKHGIRVPLSSILAQVQLEAVLWGIGTARCELPLKSMSGGTVDAMKELEATTLTEDSGFLTTRLNLLKNGFLSHAHTLNFFSILVLSSGYLKNEQDMETATLQTKLSRPSDDSTHTSS